MNLEAQDAKQREDVAAARGGVSLAATSAATPAEDAKQLVLKRLLAAHETWFDVSRDHVFGGRTFPGYAEFHSSAEQYVLVKRAKLWEVNAHEYLFFVTADRLTAQRLEDEVAFMTTKALDKVQPNPEHMTSYLSLVVIADAVDDDARRAVKKTRFRKNFKLGFQGWADLRLAVVDLSTSSIITNAMGKELRASLEANAFGES
ncbi:MAG: hypothetical protein Q4C41_02065 [Eggerthellaceae bacterium]|nr:hypothetical protein [Eggerthellaceae bacterium]